MSYSTKKRTGEGATQEEKGGGKPKGTVGYLQTVCRAKDQIFKKKMEKGRERKKWIAGHQKQKETQHLISPSHHPFDTAAQKLKTPSEREWDRK